MTYKEFIFQYSLGTLDYNSLINLTTHSKDKRILTILSKDENSNVRCYATYNPNTPIEILEELSKDEDYYVRYYVSKNPNSLKTELKEKVKRNDIHNRT